MRVRVVAGAAVLAGAAMLGAWFLPVSSVSQAEVVTVYKSPTCGCCTKWVDHMKKAGFEVRTVDLPDLTEVKQTSGVPLRLRTCHTALVGGYVVEGHVPPELVRKMLAEKPTAAGLAVPGMPIGSRRTGARRSTPSVRLARHDRDFDPGALPGHDQQDGISRRFRHDGEGLDELGCWQRGDRPTPNLLFQHSG